MWCGARDFWRIFSPPTRRDGGRAMLRLVFQPKTVYFRGKGFHWHILLREASLSLVHPRATPDHGVATPSVKKFRRLFRLGRTRNELYDVLKEGRICTGICPWASNMIRGKFTPYLAVKRRTMWFKANFAPAILQVWRRMALLGWIRNLWTQYLLRKREFSRWSRNFSKHMGLFRSVRVADEKMRQYQVAPDRISWFLVLILFYVS